MAGEPLSGSPETLERTVTSRGELVLRRVDGRYGIISNGVFLMDTSDGSSERLLVEAAVDRCAATRLRVLIAGLGVGFSLNRALEFAEVGVVDVVEIEDTIIRWHTEYLQDLTGTALRDPRVRIVATDLIDWLAESGQRYDVICIDTDNGPNWLVFDRNQAIYDGTGLDMVRAHLRDGGIAAVWSASRDHEFEERVRARFGQLEILTTPKQRGAADVVYLARRTPCLTPGT